MRGWSALNFLKRSLRMASRRRLFTVCLSVAFAASISAQVSLPPGASGIYTPTKMQQFVSLCPVWRTDGGFQSSIRLTNMLAISNVDVQVTLTMADGTAYALAPLRLPASGVATVNVNDALASAPANVMPHVSPWGSASISYRYDWQGVILATMSLLDTPRSLQYVYAFVFLQNGALSTMAGTWSFEGLWWKPT